MRASSSRRTRSDSSSSAVSTPAIAGRVWETVRDSTRLVGRPVFFSMAIILLAFIPVFALTGQEGKLFHPLGLHQDVCGARGDGHRRHARPGALHVAARGEVPSGRGQPRHACASRSLPAGAAERARASGAHDHGRRGSLRRSAGPGAWDRERVHAAAQRGRPDVHAHRRSQHLARGEHQDRGPPERRLDEVSGSRLRRRQGRTGRHVNRSGTAQHDRDHRPPEAEAASGGRE